MSQRRIVWFAGVLDRPGRREAARKGHCQPHANAPFNSCAPTPAASPAHQKGEWPQNAECPPWRCSKGLSKAAEDQTQMRWSVPCQWSTERPGRELELSFSWQSLSIISDDPCSGPNLLNLTVSDFAKTSRGNRDSHHMLRKRDRA